MPTPAEIDALARELLRRHNEYEFGSGSSPKGFARWLATQYGCSVEEVYRDFRQKAEWRLSKEERA